MRRTRPGPLRKTAVPGHPWYTEDCLDLPLNHRVTLAASRQAGEMLARQHPKEVNDLPFPRQASPPALGFFFHA